MKTWANAVQSKDSSKLLAEGPVNNGEHEPGEENRVGKNAKNGMSKQRQSFDLLFDIIVAGRCRAEKLCDTAWVLR